VKGSNQKKEVVMNAKLFAIIFLSAILFLIPTNSKCAEIKITDSSGEIIELQNAKIDYTEYPTSFGFYKKDYEYSGIRIHRGSGVTTVHWKNIVVIKISGVSKATITLTSGKEYEVTLVSASKKGLFGTTDLGEYEIPLISVKKIEVTKP
jgi:hypothetical protein